jgi:26S proteasome regulatory subunit N1
MLGAESVLAAALQEEVGAWGHEYVRNLAGEIGQEYQARREAEQPSDDLLKLVSQIVPYQMTHNAGNPSPSLLTLAFSPIVPHQMTHNAGNPTL